MRSIFKYIAILIYKKKYNHLKDKLLAEYELVKYDNSSSLNTISKILISGEDHRFFYHIGFDIIAIFRALRNRIIFRKIEGASTINQQLVRVLTNDFEITFRRKIQEICLATTISSIVPKGVIPKIYLNVAYYGTGMKGLSQVFSKLEITDREKISIEQAAEIVSMIKYPLPAKPGLNHLFKIHSRREYLIKLYKKHIARKFFKNHY